MPMAKRPLQGFFSPRSKRVGSDLGDIQLSQPPAPGWEDKRLADSEYSRKSRLLIALVNDIKALAGSQFDLDIPCLAFIGNQSAGKSSVVERATGIAVPRDSGTCTKCPMQCTMMQATGPWSCEITLQFAYDSQGKDKTPSTSVSFQTVYDPKDVEIWLKRAQAAILSPDTDPKEFHAKSNEEIKALQAQMLPFSKNTIELLVKDPDGTDLCFVDLPGIIQHHATDDKMVPFVKNLVEQHIRKKNTLIVVTIPMTDDMENQEAFRFAKKADRKGLRTIGVGTKPDMLGPGSLSQLDAWKKILEGETGLNHLQHGYYCVKMPDDRERQEDLTRQEVEGREEQFFQSTVPWMDIGDRSRLGMRNFVENTSKLLISLIETNLPTIKSTVEELLAKERKELEQLPPAVTTGSPLTYIMYRLMDFCKVLQGSILETLDKEFIHRNQARYTLFKTQIINTKPDLQPYGPLESVGDAPRYWIDVHDVTKAIRSNLTWELPNYVPFDVTKYFILQHIQHWEDPLTRCFEDVSENTVSLINQLLQDPEHFGRFSELHAFVRGILDEEKTLCRDEVSIMLKKIFDLENSVPIFTANHEAYTRERTEWLSELHQYQHNNSYSDEHKVMADIHAYFEVASWRFIDHVVLCIEGEWHRKLVARLEKKLIDNLPSLSPERLEAMMREDPAISLKRERLTQRIEQLMKIKERLSQYENEAARGVL